LPALDSDAFDIYMEWLYKTRIDTEDESEDLLTVLFKAHILGDLLDNQTFCRYVLEAIIEVCVGQGKLPATDHINYVYDKTPSPCSLRRLLVGLFRQLPNDVFNPILEGWEDYPVEFTRDLMEAFVLGAKQPIAWEVDALKSELCTTSNTNDGSDSEAHDEDYIDQESEAGDDDLSS
jgi:hypothetical protein